MNSPSDNALIREQAAAWLTELHDGLPNEDTVAAFDAWMNESPVHAEVYFELSETFYAMDAVAPLIFNEDANTDAQMENTAKEHIDCSTADVISINSKAKANKKRGFRSPRFFKSLAAAASVAALFVLSQSILLSNADLTTATGEIALHELPDASSAHLNSDTQINLAYSENERALDLLGGEAYFTVAKDPQRPFIVRTLGAQVKALGTEFLVHNRGKGVIEVSVFESSVEVTHPDFLDYPIVVAAGESILFGANSNYAGLETFDITDGAAWREGKLILKETPLKEVVDILQAHHQGKIILSKDLENLPISGVFNKIEPARILGDIAETQNLETINVANRLVYVYK